MEKLVRKYPVWTAAAGFFAVYVLFYLIPTPNEAAGILLRFGFAAVLLYVMYLAGGRQVFAWERGSFLRSLRLYKSVLIIMLIPTAVTGLARFFTGEPLPGWQERLAVAGVDALAVGLFEETWFRGVILCGLVAKFGRTRKGLLVAVLGTSLLFGFIHVAGSLLGPLSPAVVLQMVLKTLETGAMGVLIAVTYLKTRNIWAVAFLHGLGDYFSFAIQAVYTGSSGEGYVSETLSAPDAAIFIVFTLIGLIPAVIGLKHLKKMPLPELGFWKTGEQVCSAADRRGK